MVSSPASECRTATNSRAEQVANILERRSQFLPTQIAIVERGLQARASTLHRLAAALLKGNPNAPEHIDSSISAIRERIRSELDVLSKLKSRFSRATLNIGVMGLMGQGKSTLLKSLSGLSDAEIPAYEGAACTAVRSVLTNKEGAIDIKVTMHSEKTLLEEVIYPYYDSLKLEAKPLSLDEFAHASLPDQTFEKETDRALYRTLRQDYHQNLQHYQHLIVPGTEPYPRQVTAEEVADYVMQRRNAQGELIAYKHLAVREVGISCPFQNPDVGKISLVDIPGLGDSKLGDEQILLETLGREVDVVLFITRPDPQRYQWRDTDTALYDRAANALNNLAERSFMVVNRSQRTQNDKACQALRETLQMKVVSCEIADCSNLEDANLVFDRVLNHLTDHILELDKAYAQECQDRLVKIQQDIETLRLVIKETCGIHGNGSRAIDDLFDDLFGTDQEGWWRKMTIAFQDLRFEFATQSQLPSDHLASGIEAVYEACKREAGILTDEDAKGKIQEQIKASDPMKAYSSYRNQLRTLLSDHFSHLDEGLKETTQAVKTRVAKILIEDGELGVTVEGLEGAEFLKAFRAIVEREHPDLERLRQGLRIIDEFELSYSGLIEPQIYRHVVDLSNIQLSDEKEPTLKVGPNTTAEMILPALEIDYDRTVARVKAALEELLYQPNTAAYARIEKLIDSIIYHKDAQKDWKKFLRRVRSLVWKEEIGNLEQEETRQQEWQTMMTQLEEANRVETIQFIS
jgi:energy-coupling factor transporter ATP-binding protein EcfA2